MYTNYENSINIYEFGEKVKEWIYSITRKLSSIVTSQSLNENIKVSNEFFLTYQDDSDSKINVLVEKLATYLKTESILESEYYDFLDIKLLIKIALRNKNAKEITIIQNIIKELIKITDFKFSLIHEANIKYNKEFSFENLPQEFKSKFQEKYEIFEKFLLESKFEFYTMDNKKPEIDTSYFFEIMDDEFIYK